MARILLLSLVFPPDAVSTAQIMGDLAVDLRSAGHDLTVVTTTPHYIRDLQAESIQPMRQHWAGVVRRSDYHGIPVYHVSMPKKGANRFLRVMSWLDFHLVSTLVSIISIERPDIILAPSPPLTIGLSAWFLGRFHRAPFVYNVQEVFPDAAIRLGALRNPWLIHLLYRLERFIYDTAGAVTVIAPIMRAQIVGRASVPEKVTVIPNFVDLKELQPLPKDNPFSRRHKLHDRFVVSYAGNLGPAQDLGSFIEAADLLRNEPKIVFLMMGEGILKEKLERMIAKKGLANVLFLPYQPHELMPQIYGASDISLVPQAPGTHDVAVPSKVYRIMACARPVLAVTETKSDIADLLAVSGGGVVAEPGNPRQLADLILRLSNDPTELERMGRMGREHVTLNYSRERVAGLYHELVCRLVGTNGHPTSQPESIARAGDAVRSGAGRQRSESVPAATVGRHPAC